MWYTRLKNKWATHVIYKVNNPNPTDGIHIIELDSLFQRL